MKDKIIEAMKRCRMNDVTEALCQECPYRENGAHCIDQLFADAARLIETLASENVAKQSEGKWKKSNIPDEKYVCSVCGGACWYYDYQGELAKSRYCPSCGAKMKGGAVTFRTSEGGA